jgi:DNA-binding response OmpR family regulator
MVQGSASRGTPDCLPCKAVLSGTVLSHHIHSLSLGVDAVFEKPVDMKELINTIGTVTDGSTSVA